MIFRPSNARRWRDLRAAYDLKPLVIHANYLINVAGTDPEMLEKSVSALRAEMERAISLHAEYVVLHPGSFRGCSRQEGLANACAAIARASDGLNMADNGLTLLIENTAGAEFSLGSSFESVAELIAALATHIPVASCIDTCHTHVQAAMTLSARRATRKPCASSTPPSAWPTCASGTATTPRPPAAPSWIATKTSAREPSASKPFRRLLHDPRHAHAAFILETPIDEPLDDLHNVEALKALASPAGGVCLAQVVE